MRLFRALSATIAALLVGCTSPEEQETMELIAQFEAAGADVIRFRGLDRPLLPMECTRTGLISDSQPEYIDMSDARGVIRLQSVSPILIELTNLHPERPAETFRLRIVAELKGRILALESIPNENGDVFVRSIEVERNDTAGVRNGKQGVTDPRNAGPFSWVLRCIDDA